VWRVVPVAGEGCSFEFAGFGQGVDDDADEKVDPG
jgi:hypothetical protein